MANSTENLNLGKSLPAPLWSTKRFITQKCKIELFWFLQMSSYLLSMNMIKLIPLESSTSKYKKSVFFVWWEWGPQRVYLLQNVKKKVHTYLFCYSAFDTLLVWTTIFYLPSFFFWAPFVGHLVKSVRNSELCMRLYPCLACSSYVHVMYCTFCCFIMTPAASIKLYAITSYRLSHSYNFLLT